MQQDNLKNILQKYWGYPDFRGIQRQIIENVMLGRDTLGLMPTGGGKSITFQVPTLAMDGLCIVVTPLIALMKDQVANLRRRGIMAAAIYAGQSRAEITKHLDNAIFGAYKFLYVSPERLSTTIFVNKVQRMKVCLITVDEAHCISQWGYDFRPQYLRIAEIRKLLPEVPVLALTATATHMVVDDICRHLAFGEGSKVFKMSFVRPNLRYVVRHIEKKTDELLHILSCVEGSVIVYARSRMGTKEVADMLNENGITALYYHAGLTTLEKDTRQQAWQSDRVRVMVATNAFGMGIDKPDVRLVVHMDVPDSVEAYFQEAGRGGRDGQTAYAVLLTTRGDDVRLRKHITQGFPERDYIRRVYLEIASFLQVGEGEGEGRTFNFDMAKFCRVFHHFPAALVSALNLLTQAGYIHFSIENNHSSRMMFLVTREELYDIHFMSDEEEQLLYAAMRTIGGFFADYMEIEEDRLAQACGRSQDEVYEMLCHLSKLRIINYVPHTDMPQITYTQRRVDNDYIIIPRSIYEDQMELYKKRVEAMVGYINDQTVCRSRYLLHYFDDEGPDCGYCDVCVGRESYVNQLSEAKQIEAARQYVLQFLADGNAHYITDFNQSGFKNVVMSKALQQLSQEHAIEHLEGMIKAIVE